MVLIAMPSIVDGLRHYLRKKGIDAEFFEFSENTVAAENSSRVMGVPIEAVVKTMVFTDGKIPVIAILQGNRRVDAKRLSIAVGTEVRIAKAREVESMTNFKVGEVPPIGHPQGTKIFVDTPVSAMGVVVAGGGSTHTLLKIKASDIITLSGAKVADISE